MSVFSNAEIEARCIGRSNFRPALKPIMAKEYWLAFVIPIVLREFSVRQFIFPPVHPKGGRSKRRRVLVPPTQPSLLPLMPILAEKMDTRRQRLLWAFQEYFDSVIGI